MNAIEQAWTVLKEWSNVRGRRAPPTTARIQNKPDSGKYQLQQAIRDARPVRHKPEWNVWQRGDDEDMQQKFEALRALAEQQGGARNE